MHLFAVFDEPGDLGLANGCTLLTGRMLTLTKLSQFTQLSLLRPPYLGKHTAESAHTQA
jgi:hypothetical protein